MSVLDGPAERDVGSVLPCPKYPKPPFSRPNGGSPWITAPGQSDMTRRTMWSFISVGVSELQRANACAS